MSADLDIDLIHANSGISLLMCAASSGRPDLVAALLQARANVSSRSSDNCTALNFALDCAWGEDANTCVRLLLEARADPNAKYGLMPFDASFGTGTGLMAGCMTALAGDEAKFNLLLRHGYDATAKSDYGLSLLVWAGLASSKKPSTAPFIKRLLDLKCHYEDSLDTARPRISKQEGFGMITYNMGGLSIPPNMWTWLVNRFHVSETLFQSLIDTVDPNFSNRIFKTPTFIAAYEIPMLSACCKHPALLNGEVGPIRRALDKGLDMLTTAYIIEGCVGRTIVGGLILGGITSLPATNVLINMTLPNTAYHVFWNHATWMLSRSASKSSSFG